MNPEHQTKSAEYKHLRAQAALPGRGGIARIWAAFCNTLRGLREGLSSEAAIKQEVAIALIAILLAALVWIAALVTRFGI